MMSILNKKLFRLIIGTLFLSSIALSIVHAVTVSTSTNIYVTAEVGATTTPPINPPGGGGATGVPTSTSNDPATVHFAGMAYPSSRVVILQDGVQAATTTADQNAVFNAVISGLKQGTYTFSIYTLDKDGYHSVSFSFPLYVTAGATVTVGDIILAPTIDVDKTEVKKGDIEAIFGYAAPNSKVTISVHSDEEHLVNVTTGNSGAYLYNFDTSVLEYGGHNARSKATRLDKVSISTNPVEFTVTDANKTKTKGCGTLIGDISCDGKVNLVDFSIMAFWYKKKDIPPAAVDLNGDGKITLVDFSILAYHWTG